MVKVTENYKKDTFCGLKVSTGSPVPPPPKPTETSSQNNEDNGCFSLFSTILLCLILVILF